MYATFAVYALSIIFFDTETDVAIHSFATFTRVDYISRMTVCLVLFTVGRNSSFSRHLISALKLFAWKQSLIWNKKAGLD